MMLVKPSHKCKKNKSCITTKITNISKIQNNRVQSLCVRSKSTTFGFVVKLIEVYSPYCYFLSNHNTADYSAMMLGCKGEIESVFV